MTASGQHATFPALSRMSVAGGESDVFRQKADFGTRMSAVRGNADVPATWPGSPLLAEGVEKVPGIRILETMIQSREQG